MKTEDGITEIDNSFDSIRYRKRKYEHFSAFTDIPCHSCPVSHVCEEGGVVNPTDCIFLDAWTDITDIEDLMKKHTENIDNIGGGIIQNG